MQINSNTVQNNLYIKITRRDNHLKIKMWRNITHKQNITDQGKKLPKKWKNTLKGKING